MELRQLEYFVAVAEEGSFTRAAARVHVAQPGVSAQVRRLERELGHELLDRSGRSVRMTEVGAAVLPYARAALGAVAAVRVAVDELAGLVRGRVAVGTVAGSPPVDLPGLLADFHARHPGVDLTLAEDLSSSLVDGLRTGRFDLALISSPATPPRDIETQVLIDEPLVAAVSHDHPLASRSTLTVSGLRGRALITLPRGTGLRTSIEDACMAAGFRPHVTLEASAPHVLAQLAGRGLGLAVLPSSSAASHRDLVHAITITRPHLRGRLALAWRRHGPAGPAADAVICHARAYLAAPSDR